MSSVSKYKPCKSCRHAERFYTTYVCKRYKAIDHVNGKVLRVLAGFCGSERSNAKLCGPEAKYFEPKPPSFFDNIRLFIKGLLDVA